MEYQQFINGRFIWIKLVICGYLVQIGGFLLEKNWSWSKLQKIDFVGLLKKDSIPADVYNTLKEFYPYNQQK